MERKILDEFAKKLTKRFGRRVRKVILFGSAARGEMHKESDIDILVVVDKKDDAITRRIEDIAFDMMERIGVLISPVVVGEHAYTDMHKERYPFIVNVEEEGVILG